MTTGTLTEKKPGKKQLFERIFTPKKITIEERQEGDPPNKPLRMRVEGMMSKAGETTGNGRRYGLKIWERHVGDRNSDFMKRIKERKVLGCLEHPEEEPSLDHVSHLVEDAWLTKDGEVHARILILNEGKGKLLRELFEVGHPVGASSRGEGSTSLADDGVTEDVDDDYELETWDFVHTPAIDTARARPVAESMGGRKEKVAMNEALKKARETVTEAESKNLSALGLHELTSLHISIVESMTPLATATESEASEVRGRLAGLGSQVSKAIGEKTKTKDDKVAEAVNAQFPDAMTGISALVEKLVKQSEAQAKRIKELEGGEGSEIGRKLEAAMKAGQQVVNRCEKLMKEKQTLAKKYGIAVRTLDKVMEAVRAKGLAKQVETLCGKIPQLRYVKSELLKSKTAKELESRVKTFSKLISEKKETTPAKKTESKTKSSRSREPLPPTKVKKGKTVTESKAATAPKSQGFFSRMAKRGL
jgi:hypothetical protein